MVRNVPQAAQGYTPGMTPHSIPTALAALYLAELRLGERAIQKGKWDDLWRSVSAEMKMPLPLKAKASGIEMICCL